MRSNPGLTDAVAMADTIHVILNNTGCERHDSCWSVSPMVKVDMAEDGWLTRHAQRFTCLTLVEALDAMACWAAFLGSELETRAQLAMQPTLPWPEELMG
jgi:hypothetical protein